MMPAMKVTVSIEFTLSPEQVSVEFTLSPEQAETISKDKNVVAQLLCERVRESLTDEAESESDWLPGEIAVAVTHVQYDYGIVSPAELDKHIIWEDSKP